MAEIFIIQGEVFFLGCDSGYFLHLGDGIDRTAKNQMRDVKIVQYSSGLQDPVIHWHQWRNQDTDK